jgi:uncharacterized membrane protein
MTTAAGSSAEIEAYLAAVAAALSDLPQDERADLLAEVEASLVEAVGDGDRPIASLGPPEAFAAELRASAGLGERAAAPASASGIDAIRSLVTVLARRPAVRAVLRLGRELAPAWWLVRGCLVVAAIAAATGASWSIAHPWLPHLPSARASAFWLVVAIVASFALGLRTRGRASTAVLIAVLAIDVVALLAIVPVERHVRDSPSAYALGEPAVVYVPQPVPGLALDGQRVMNVYPYSRSGTLLHDVLLYDDSGRAITLGLGPDPLRRVLRGVSTQVIANAFPVRYYDADSQAAGLGRRVTDPDAAPAVRVPKIVTPPLAP